MTDGDQELRMLDRATLSLARRVSRRSVLAGSLGVVAGVAGLKLLTPIDAAACTGCHYCVSGCTTCNVITCCSFGTRSCWQCASCGAPAKIGDYVCDNYCQYWCNTLSC